MPCVHDEWIANRWAELIELKSDLSVRLRFDSQQTDNSGPQPFGCQGREHSGRFLSERSFLFLRQIMSNHFQGEVSAARNHRLLTADSRSMGYRDELD